MRADYTHALIAAAVTGMLACKSAHPPSAPVEPSAPTSTAAPRVIGAPKNPPGTAHPPMRDHWVDALHDDSCKEDPKSGLPCPSRAIEKACCAGKNDCKGRSGCRTNNACSGPGKCAGQNDCKGRGTSCPPVPQIP